MEDKERVKIHEDPIPNPKKRTKVTNNADSRRAPNPSTVLSPKSANSRTLPQSPIRTDLSLPQKGGSVRPVSPLKPVQSTGKNATAAATAALATMIGGKTKPGRPKAVATKLAAAQGATREPTSTQGTDGLRSVSSTSNSSAFSTGTTIVKKAKDISSSAKKKPAGNKGVGRKVAGVTEAPAQGRRVLRKRG